MENEFKIKHELLLSKHDVAQEKNHQRDFLGCSAVVPSLHNIEHDDLFNELNTSIDSFDSIGDIDFCYDDPFRVF